VNVRSIVKENVPAQVTALTHWSPRSCLKRGNEPSLHGINYSPCMCHFVQFVVADLMTGTWLGDFEIMLQEMTMIANFSEVDPITKSRCPSQWKKDGSLDLGSFIVCFLMRNSSLEWISSCFRRNAHLTFEQESQNAASPD
jgi:hypothetical protein